MGIFMETRKVQITGKSTYIISLPKSWVNKVNIKNGDSISLVPRSDGTLLVNPKFNEKGEVYQNSIEIESRDIDILYRKFIGAYLSGFNLIEIYSKNRLSPDMRKIIRKMIHNVIGPEIIDETSQSVKVKDLLDSSDLSLTRGLKRMYVITRSMFTDAVLSLQKQDLDLAEDVESRDDEVDKFYWMIAKQYNLVLNDLFFAEKMKIKTREALGYLLVARSIERIADHAKKLAGNIKHIKIDQKMREKIVKASDEILSLFDKSFNSFNRDNFETANDTISKAKKLSNSTNKLNDMLYKTNTNSETIASLAIILDSLERTRAYAIDIAEAAINHQYTKIHSE
jgi:phosphate uptake regulator